MNNYTKYLKTVNKTQVYGKCTQELSGGGNTDRYPRQLLTYSSDKQTCYLHPAQKPIALMEYLLKTYTNVYKSVFYTHLNILAYVFGCLTISPYLFHFLCR